MHPRQIHQRAGDSFNLNVRVGDSGGFEKLVVDLVGDKRVGEAAKVLLQGGRDGVDVYVGIGNVDILLLDCGLEAVFDDLDLAGAAGFAVDAFYIHACAC